MLDPWYAVASYLFVPDLMPDSDKIWPVAIHGWSLNYDMMFYLLFAAGLALGRDARLPASRPVSTSPRAVAGGLALGVVAYGIVEKPMLRVMFRKRDVAAPAQVATGP